MGPRNSYKDMLDNVVSPIACVSMNHQNQLEQMSNGAMFATPKPTISEETALDVRRVSNAPHSVYKKLGARPWCQLFIVHWVASALHSENSNNDSRIWVWLYNIFCRKWTTYNIACDVLVYFGSIL
jgi:hypothetical protein